MSHSLRVLMGLIKMWREYAFYYLVVWTQVSCDRVEVCVGLCRPARHVVADVLVRAGDHRLL